MKERDHKIKIFCLTCKDKKLINQKPKRYGKPKNTTNIKNLWPSFSIEMLASVLPPLLDAKQPCQPQVETCEA